MKPTKLYTVKDLCELIGYTRQGISLLVRDNRIRPCFRTERLILFSEKEVKRIVERFKLGKYRAFKA